MLATTVTWPRPPRRCPTRRFEKANNRSVIPEAFITFPARRKKGIAIIGKESIAANIREVMITMGIRSLIRLAKRTDIPIAKAIGIRISTQNRNARNTSINSVTIESPLTVPF